LARTLIKTKKALIYSTHTTLASTILLTLSNTVQLTITVFSKIVTSKILPKSALATLNNTTVLVGLKATAKIHEAALV
jgi:hypothetical protein